MQDHRPTIPYEDPRDSTIPRRRTFSMYGFVACLAAGLTLCLLAQLAAGTSQYTRPFIVPAIFFSAATAIIGTTLALLDRRKSPTFAILALSLSAATLLLVCGVMNIGIGALWRWIRQMLF